MQRFTISGPLTVAGLQIIGEVDRYNCAPHVIKAYGCSVSTALLPILNLGPGGM